MGTDPIIVPQSDTHRYEAVVRISEAIAACGEPEELARTLADEIGKFLHFDHLYFMVLRENSKEIEHIVWGKGPIPFPDLPMEEWPTWEALHRGEPQHTGDWDTEERYPRFKEWAKKMGLGSGLRIPLTTPHRRLGVFGINRDAMSPFSEEEISFLWLIGRVVAFALDDGLNLRRSQEHNERLKLLLNLTNRITSNLELRDLFRGIAANIREVIHADAVVVSLPDAASGKFRVFAVDFPQGKGVLKEELLVAESPAASKAMDTLKPVIVNTWEQGELMSEPYGLVAEEDIKTFCTIPLVNRSRALGILSILRTTETPFTPEAVDFLSRASGPIAIAVENAVARAELQRQNEQLHRSRRELREVIEGIPSMAWSTASDGAAEFFNRRWLDYAGLSPDQLRGRGWTVAVHPDDLNAVVDYWRGVLASRKPGEIEARLRRFDGVYRWFLFRAIPFFDDNGGIVKWFGTNTDIEERKRAEQALALQNTRLQLLLQLTKRITSNLEFREVLRTIAANIREVIHADAAGIAFYDAASAKSRIYVVDFPNARGFVKEEILVEPGDAFMRAWESSKPVTLVANDRKELGSEIYELVVAEGLNAHCLIPLVSHDRPVGVLILARRGEGFTHEDVDFLREASGQIAIAIENALAYHEISQLKDKLAQEKLYLEEEIRSEMNFENIIGDSPALKHVLELVETVATSDSTVLLLGETGTGKELIARAIHDRSRRKDRTFVKLNCAAIPTGLLESELFGHEKGAFTGAIALKVGRMELADQGTLFLDEVGDIPIEIQPKLLRALQEREFERLGSTHTRRANIRLVAATNRDLEQMIADREFRSDLYYRLYVFPIRIPPLRERKEDIPQLVSYFVQKFAKQMQKKIDAISPAVMKGLTAWDWPGNIRELENFIERAVIVTRGRSLEAPLGELRKTNTVEIPRSEDRKLEPIAGERTSSQNDRASVAGEFERRQRDDIIRALSACKGRVGGADGAAAQLGMNRTTLLARMKKFGIFAKQYA